MSTNRSGNLNQVMQQAVWDSATRVPEGDIRALKHRIHTLEGEVIGYKRILDAQRTWVGLTEDEAIELLPEGDWEIESTLDFAQAIEAKLRSKNI